MVPVGLAFGRKPSIEIPEELERRAHLESIVAQIDEVESDSATICSIRRGVRASNSGGALSRPATSCPLSFPTVDSGT